MTNPEVGLMFPTGISRFDMDEFQQYDGIGSFERLVALIRNGNNGYVLRLFDCKDAGYGHRFQYIEDRDADDLDSAAKQSEDLGVGFILPTSHAYRAGELAQFAEKLGLMFPSPAVVEMMENKELFYTLMQDAGVSVPPFITCRKKREVVPAAKKLGGYVVLKTESGSSGEGCITLDLNDYAKKDIDDVIDWHWAHRRKLGCKVTIVQASVGDQEWGFQTMGKTVQGSPESAMHMTTRKDTLYGFGRWLDHTIDPYDEVRIRYTNELIVPEARLAAQAIHNYDKYIGGNGLPQNWVMNADFRTEGGEVWLLDASPRWFPRGQRAANATRGLLCGSKYFPEMALRWSQGEPIPDEALAPVDQSQQRAVIMHKAFAGGGIVIKDPNYNEEFSKLSNQHPAEVFYAEKHKIGNEIRSIFDAEQSSSVLEQPVVCVSGKDLAEATSGMYAYLASLGTAVLSIRNKTISGHAPSGSWAAFTKIKGNGRFVKSIEYSPNY